MSAEADLSRALAGLSVGGAARAHPSAAAPIVLLFQALPLCGKSTLCRGLFDLLVQARAVPRWLNQDEIACAGS